MGLSMGRMLLFALAVGFSVPVVAQEIKSQAATVSVCELVKNPSEYHGQMVQVHSRVYPAMIDTPTVLFDSRCARSIRLDTYPIAEAYKVQAYRDFRRYLNEWRTIEATLFGRFEMTLVPSKEPMLAFRLLRVADVSPGPAFFPERRKSK